MGEVIFYILTLLFGMVILAVKIEHPNKTTTLFASLIIKLAAWYCMIYAGYNLMIIFKLL